MPGPAAVRPEPATDSGMRRKRLGTQQRKAAAAVDGGTASPSCAGPSGGGGLVEPERVGPRRGGT